MPIEFQANKGGCVPWMTPSERDLIRMLELAECCKSDGDYPAYQGILNVTMQAMVAKQSMLVYNRHLYRVCAN
jgi:hypothetical protein